MKPVFEKYKPRNIACNGTIRSRDWDIKVYMITNKHRFQSKDALENSIGKLPDWIASVEKSPLPIYKKAFLIVHEAREGVWILLNWWTGGEMIDSKVYFSKHGGSDQIIPSPYHSDALVCIWELEVFTHERKAWITHVLTDHPNFENYLNDTL